ncbi:hypothetical protein Sste5346_010340 [Sporothrix stenoceras]|uniref:3-hydroxyisobutyrate dehydrogenase n=1 Tax=Sporothrix stenoceras TaxID=5173 RepID=A0ABR3YFZ1_9PEZI
MAVAVRRSLDKKHMLYVFDVYMPSCERFKEQNSQFGPIEILTTPRDIATKADAVISMVPGPPEVKKIFLDEDTGMIGAPENHNRLFLECSTIDTETARSVAAKVHEAKRGTYIDAPVSGGVPAAENRTLSFIVGHAKREGMSVLDRRLNALILSMGDPNKVFWCGGIGLGLAAKISNNYISCSVLLLIAEAMAIGVKAGVDPKLLQEVIHNSTGQTFMGDNVCPVPGVVAHAPSSNDWKLGFKTQMFLKDLSLGINTARQLDLDPTMAEQAYRVFEKASQDPRCIDRDGSSVYLYITDEQTENGSTDKSEL